MPPQSSLLRQPRQARVLVSQNGASGSVHSVSLRQPFTQVAVITLHSGALAGQASVLVAEHWPQAPVG